MRGWFNLHPKALAWGACLLPLVLSACATHPARPPVPEGHAAPPPVDTTYLPRLLLPGASLPEVRSLAMGAARARGWTVRQEGSGDDRFVVERPADPAIVAQVAPQMAQVPGSNLEVTTFLKEEGGMLEVAMRAELVIPQPAGGQPMRIDYTDAFSPALMQSLEALRERWIQDRERLARATPPPEGWKSAWDESADPISTEIERPQRGGMGSTAQPVATAAASASAAQPQTRPATPLAASVPPPRYDRQAAASSRPQTPAAATSGSPARPPQVAAAGQAKPQAPVIDASRPAAAAQTRPAAPQAPAASAARPTASATPATRATPPATPTARPAPTTAAGNRTPQTQPSAGTRPAVTQPPAPTRTAPAPTAGARPGTAPAAANRPAQTAQAARPATPAATSPTRPAQTPTPPAARPASTPAAANRTPPAKAEQYARQRGCRAGGAQLIESRRDGEVYRVPCQGSDSLLVHCRAGSCKGLL